MKKLIVLLCLLTSLINSREIGQTEITTEEGIEVYQKEKYYLLKKNVNIESDNFNLKAQTVKAYFQNDLYDLTDIFSKGNVVLISNSGLSVKGKEVDFNVKNENIKIRGEESFLENTQFTMKANKVIEVNNTNGEFKIIGINSTLLTPDIYIKGESIKGVFSNVNGENIVEKLNVEDKKQINIKTETLNMFAKKADFDKKNNIIELFENVKIMRGEELILGDYAKINTLNESYKITSKKSKKVKVLISKTDE